MPPAAGVRAASSSRTCGARCRRSRRCCATTVAVALEEPPDLPPPFPLLAGTVLSKPEERTRRWAASTPVRFDSNGTRERLAHNGRQPDLGGACRRWSRRRRSSWRGTTCRSSRPPGVVCEFAEGAPSRVLINLPGDVAGADAAGYPAPDRDVRSRPRFASCWNRTRPMYRACAGSPCSIRRVCTRYRSSAGEPTAMCPDAPGTEPDGRPARSSLRNDVARWVGELGSSPLKFEDRTRRRVR